MAASVSNPTASVDVIIAVWNNAGTVGRAIRSALSQVDVNRVIVIDDHSTDNTFSVVCSLINEVGNRIVLHRLDRNGGPSAARNSGLRLSNAPWVAVLDGDDYFLPERIRTLLDASDGADFVADDQIQIREGESEDFNSCGNSLIGLKSQIKLDLATFLTKNISSSRRHRKEFGFLKPIMRRAFLDLHQLRFDERLRLGEDFALYARALAAGAAFRIIPSRTYVSVVRSGSISVTHTREDLERLRDSDKALQQLPALTPEEMLLVQQHYESIDARVQWLNVIDAVKGRRVAEFISPFVIRPITSVYLICRLLEELMMRSKRLLGLP
jgi:succinoglycan biosynthesis protein ExoU